MREWRHSQSCEVECDRCGRRGKFYAESPPESEAAAKESRDLIRPWRQLTLDEFVLNRETQQRKDLCPLCAVALEEFMEYGQ
jgi:hypothetical protein